MNIEYTIRGSDWLNGPAWVRSVLRFWGGPDNRYFLIGFRIIEDK